VYISFDEEFIELRCIGRGNFGAAFLVQLRNTPNDEKIYFIAKKIILGQLTEKEQQGAYLEVSLPFQPNTFAGRTSQEVGAPEHRQLQALVHRKRDFDYHYGVLRTRRHGLPHLEEEKEKGKLLRDRDHELVRPNDFVLRPRPQKKDSASRPQVLKHFSDRRLHNKVGRLRDLQSSRIDLGPCNDGLRHSLLHVPRSLSEQTLHVPVRHLGSWLHPLRALHPQACLPCRKLVRVGL